MKSCFGAFPGKMQWEMHDFVHQVANYRPSFFSNDCLFHILKGNIQWSLITTHILFSWHFFLSCMQRQSLLTDHFVLSWWPPESPKLHPQQEGAPVEHTSTQQYVVNRTVKKVPHVSIVKYLKPWLFVFEACPTFVDPLLCWNFSSNQHRLTFVDPWLCWNSSSNQPPHLCTSRLVLEFFKQLMLSKV